MTWRETCPGPTLSSVLTALAVGVDAKPGRVRGGDDTANKESGGMKLSQVRAILAEEAAAGTPLELWLRRNLSAGADVEVAALKRRPAGGLLRTSTPPTLDILLLLRASASKFTLKVSATLNSVDCLFSMTLLPGAPLAEEKRKKRRRCREDRGWHRRVWHRRRRHRSRPRRNSRNGRTGWLLLLILSGG